jgi:hypothetical protein
MHWCRTEVELDIIIWSCLHRNGSSPKRSEAGQSKPDVARLLFLGVWEGKGSGYDIIIMQSWVCAVINIVLTSTMNTSTDDFRPPCSQLTSQRSYLHVSRRTTRPFPYRVGDARLL